METANVVLLDDAFFDELLAAIGLDDGDAAPPVIYGTDDRPMGRATDPTPDEIQKMCLMIQAEWSPMEERRRRAWSISPAVTSTSKRSHANDL